MAGYGYPNQVPAAVPLGGMGPAPFGYGAPYPAYGGVYGGFWYAFLIILFIVIILFWGFWAFGSFYR
ncbi:hypothetical protein CHH55_21015 [Niallia circulans]|jgi:hypothetical protein|uniref:Sporulation protein YjcZ n=1 Tax=Niallia circulans TaxID=1397 RepID=A0A0J1IN18_NIACI|nr:hypothetical protein [Niallia circulans]KLV27356.1 hypothetical protein ABW02_07565 [Niallia circulans]MED3841503.1 sporulation protein YjcZ [Niallia circulans]MED4242457.1 sporulation protein YjcZ [Niallia circulans]MED4246435.1 sporulation protein YjcZ [Niallia circulans]MED5102285.1 sporulation protein YjcZ [Niallia circulans]